MKEPKVPPKAPQITPALIEWLEYLYPVPRFGGGTGEAERELAYARIVQRSVVDRVREEMARQERQGDPSV